VYFEAKTAVETTIYERDALDIGTVVNGPAIIEQFDATTVVPPLWRARVDGLRNLVLEKD
jgi:N-methylhydantoinase A